MEKKPALIVAKCPLFACRLCRAKNGLPHQSWCESANVELMSCGDCRHWDQAQNDCSHPVRAKSVVTRERYWLA